MSQVSLDALGKLIEKNYKEIMDKANGKTSIPPPIQGQKKLPPRKEVKEEHHLYAATFEVPVKKPLPPRKDPRFTYSSLD
jgi:hypothetical protein